MKKSYKKKKRKKIHVKCQLCKLHLKIKSLNVKLSIQIKEILQFSWSGVFKKNLSPFLHIGKGFVLDEKVNTDFLTTFVKIWETIKSILLTTSMYTQSYKSILCIFMHPKLCALIFKVLIFVRKFRKQKMSTSEIAKLTKAENEREYLC